MHFIDHIYLVARVRWNHSNIVANLTDIFDAVIGCTINFNHIHMRTSCDGLTVRTGAAGIRRGHRSRCAIQCFRHDTGRCCLPDSTGADKEKRVMDTPRAYRVLQGASDVRLSHHIVKRLWSPLSRQNQILLFFHDRLLPGISPHYMNFSYRRPTPVGSTGKLKKRDAQLQPGTPTAHGDAYLRLLPSGPDRVR